MKHELHGHTIHIAEAGWISMRQSRCLSSFMAVDKAI